MGAPDLVNVQTGLPADQVAKWRLRTERVSWTVLNIHGETLVGTGYNNSAALFGHPQQLSSVCFPLLPIIRSQSAVSENGAYMFDHAQGIDDIEEVVGKRKAAR